MHCQASGIVCTLDTYIYVDAEMMNETQISFKEFLNSHKKNIR